MSEDTKALVKGGILFAVGLFILLSIILAASGFFGPLFNQVDYNNFNSSPMHQNAVSSEVNNECLQLAETKSSDTVTVNALQHKIYNDTSTVDVEHLSAPQDVKDCITAARTYVTNQNK